MNGLYQTTSKRTKQHTVGLSAAYAESEGIISASEPSQEPENMEHERVKKIQQFSDPLILTTI